MEQENGILINAKWHRVSFVPAYIINRQQVDLALELFVKAFKDLADIWSKRDC